MNIFTPPLWVVSLAAFCSWALLRALIPLLRRRLLDLPNSRSSHFTPTPRGGGAAFVLISCLYSSFLLNPFGLSDLLRSSPVPLPILALPLALIGFLDDLYHLHIIWRYTAQVLTALLLILFCHIPMPLLAVPFLLVSVTAVINFANFMDGLDGLLAGCMIITFATLAVHLTPSCVVWSLVGALLGFLIYNWSPAKVFMGDVGSTFLGAVYAGLVLQSSSWLQALASLLIATPLLADSSICLVRRLLAGHPPFEAHRLHLYQRLHQAGWSHSQVSNLYMLATAALSFAFLSGSFQFLLTAVALELLLGLWLDQCVAVSFSRATTSNPPYQRNPQD
jgi:Fuc2NAc and GlcNAc transferase